MRLIAYESLDLSQLGRFLVGFSVIFVAHVSENTGDPPTAQCGGFFCNRSWNSG